MNTKRQIIAMGGGGFLAEPDNHVLDDYILGCSGKRTPKLCFIPTASGDDEQKIAAFYRFFEQKNCVSSHFSLFRGHTSEIETFLMEQDILYVGGGNTRNMLVLWKEWGVDRILKAAYEAGKVLCGVSAGAICWFEQGLTDSIPGTLTPLKGLGFLNGSLCPHFDSEPERRPVYSALTRNGRMKSGIAVDDGCALHYVNEGLFRIIPSKLTAKAYYVTPGGSPVIEVTEREYIPQVESRFTDPG